MCAPLNSINFSDKQDKASKSLTEKNKAKGQMMNNFVNNLEVAEDRLETHDSIANDPSLTPRMKLMRKLKRYILSSFKST